MKIHFEGLRALVTGGSRGIGRRITIDLAEAGAAVIATSTSDEGVHGLAQLAESRGWSGFRPIRADFADPSGMADFVAQLQSLEVDVCINNAGINKIDSVEEIAEEDWERILRVNLTAPRQIMAAVLPGMKERGYGRIVNISSIFGVVGRPQRGSYSASKHGLRGLTIAAALEGAGRGVLVNALAPGFIRTDLTEQILGAERMARLEQEVPLGRLGSVEDISKWALFLASSLNTYMTGQTVVVDGGFVSA